MAEKVKLIELDIDIESLKKSMGKVNSEVEQLAEKQKILKKSTIDLGVEIEKKTEQMQKAEKANKTNTASYAKLQKEVQDLKQVQKLSATERKKQLLETKSALKAKRKEERMGMNMVDAHTQKERKSIVIARQTKGSIDQISSALSKNRALYRSLTPEQRNNSKIGRELLSVIKQQDDEYKKLNNEMGVTQVNVGNYKDEMKKAIATSFNLQHAATTLLGPFGSLAPLLVANVKGVKAWAVGNRTATSATKGTSKALKFFRIALLSTGIGAIVVAFGALITYLKSTQSGIDKVNRVLTPLKVVMGALVGVVQKVGEYLYEAFMNPKEAVISLWEAIKKNIVNRITGIADTFKFLGKTIQSVLTLNFDEAKENANKLGESVTQTITGVDEFSKKVRNAAKATNDFFNDAINKGKEIADLQIKIEQRENELLVINADLRAEYEKQREIAQNVNLSFEERRKASQEAVKIQDEILDGENKLLDMKIEQKKLQHSINDTSREEQRELQEMIAERSRREAESARKRASARNLERTINREALAATNKRIDAELKASKTKLDIYIAENKAKSKSLAEQLKYEQTVHDKQVELLKEELKHKKKTQEEYELEMLNLKRDLAQKKAEITSEYASKELDIWIEQNKSKIDNETELTESLVSEEEQRLQTIYDKRSEILEQQRAYGLVSEQDYLLAKLQLQSSYLESKNDLEATYDNQKEEERQLKLDAEQTNWENEMEIRALRGESEFDLARRELDRQEKAEIEHAKKIGADVTKVKQKFSKKREAIDKAEQRAKLEGASAVLDGLSNLLGQETAAGKAVAVAKATMDTYKAANLALSTYPPPFGAIAAGISIATGLANVKKIMSTKTDVPKTGLPKAEHGATFKIGGNRHSSGGTKFYGEDGTAFEAERDEVLVVLNRAASSAFSGLSELNERHGGSAFTTTSRYLATGGVVGRGATVVNTTNTTAPAIDYDLLAQKIGENVLTGVRQLPHPVTLVQDIINETQSHNKIIDRAKF